MSFMIVIVQNPDQQKSTDVFNWGSFHAHAKLENLKGIGGVFCINDTAWLFDTRTTLGELGLVIARASEYHIQLYSFQLTAETWRSQVASCPRSDKLEVFLAS